MNYVGEALEELHKAEAGLVEAWRKPHLNPGIRQGERDIWRTDLHALSRATPYYWNSRTVQLVQTLAKDFDLSEIKASRHLLHQDCQWFYFAEDSPYTIEDYKTKEPLPVRAISTYYFAMARRPYLGVTAWTRRRKVEATGEWAGPCWPTTWSCCWEGNALNHPIEESDLEFCGYTDEKTIEELWLSLRFVAAANTFLRQEFLVDVKTPVERHARKRMEKAGQRISDISVIHLRRAATRASDTYFEAPGDAREWNFQWTVRGHVRMQPYRTTGETLPIYIHPYVKGPEDKPMKPRTTPIFSVVR